MARRQHGSTRGCRKRKQVRIDPFPDPFPSARGLWLKISRFDVAQLKRRCADDKGRGAGRQEDDFRLEELRPRRGRLKHQKPAFKMMGDEPVPVRLKKRNQLHDRVHEQIRERHDRGRRRFHVEAGKHERHRHHRHGVHGHEQV